MSDVKFHQCPSCGCKCLRYDSFEDMYGCMKCNICLYPEEVGLPKNENAGIWWIND